MRGKTFFAILAKRWRKREHVIWQLRMTFAF